MFLNMAVRCFAGRLERETVVKRWSNMANTAWREIAAVGANAVWFLDPPVSRSSAHILQSNDDQYMGWLAGWLASGRRRRGSCTDRLGKKRTFEV